MNRIYSIIICAGLASLTLSSCTREQLAPRPEGKATITATREGESTKTNISTSGTRLTWAEGDIIGAANGENISRFTLATGEDTGTATFTGDASFVAGDIYAWYPYDNSGKFKGVIDIDLSKGIIDIDLSGQALTSGESTGKYFYMVAKGTVESDAANVRLAFKNPLAAFVFNIDNNLSEDIVLKGMEVSADNAVFHQAGTIDLKDGTLDNPAVKTSDDAVNSVAVSLSGYTVSAETGYVELPLVVIPRDFTDMNLYFTLTYDKGAESGKVMTKMISGQELTRNSFAGINFVFDDASIEGGIEVSKPSDIEDLIQGTPTETEISVSASSAPATADEAKIDLSGTNLSHVENLNISLPAIPAENTDIQYNITIPDGEDAPGRVNISVADGKNNDIVIYAPATTVSIDGISYGGVTATTADNTLILEDGVTVDNLTVRKGNVRLRGKAAVTNFINSTGGTVNVIVEDSSRGDLQLQEGFVQWGLEWDLKNAFANGESYTLSSDLDITAASITVPAGKTVVLDLNGHNITAANTLTGKITVYGEMTLRDAVGTGVISSSLDYSGADTGTGYGIITANGENAKVIMESGNIEAVREDAANKGQVGIGVYDGGDFTMTGGKIEAGWYAVAGNGNNKTQHSVIAISGGELISTADYAVYLPHSGETEISGGTINGAAGGICIQRGELVISGDAAILSDGTGYTGDWSDGTGNLPNASLIVAAEYGACSVTIEGGSFSAKGDAIALNNSVTPENVNITITGGTFSDLSALAYLGENADVEVVFDKDIISLDHTLILDKAGCNVTIDLNEKTLDYTSTDNDVILVSQGNLTLKNGIIVADDYDGLIDGKPAAEGGIAARETGSISAEDIEFTSSSTGFFAGETGKLSLTGTTVDAAVYCVTSNAGTSNQKITVNLSSSIFTGGTPILLNVPSEITIDGCTVTGEMPGMIIRGGTAEISNSKITLDFKSSMSVEEVASYFEGRNWGSGNMVNVAGLTIGNKAPNAYQYPTSVKLYNTDIIVTEKSKGWLPAVYAHANEGEDLGVTFEYDNECTFTGDFTHTEGRNIVYGSDNITVNGVAVVEQPDGTFAPAAETN